MLWIALNFFPIGWPQLDAVFEHGLAYARSADFYETTLTWQWLRLPGDVLFAIGALLMAWDFLIKLGPLYPEFAERFGLRRFLGSAGYPEHGGAGSGAGRVTGQVSRQQE